MNIGRNITYFVYIFVVIGSLIATVILIIKRNLDSKTPSIEDDFYSEKVTFLSSTKNLTNDHYHWKPIVEVSDEVFKRQFLPNYFDPNNELFQQNVSAETFSTKCKSDLQFALYSMVRKRKAWAFRLFNSWAPSMPRGMMLGTMSDYGDYGQCMSVSNYQHQIEPQYCVVDMSLPMPSQLPKSLSLFHQTKVLPDKRIDDNFGETIYEELAEKSSFFYYTNIRLGICLPNTCYVNDIHHMANNGLGERRLGLRLKTVFCVPKRSFNLFRLNSVQLVSFLLVGIILLLNVGATIYDRISSNPKHKKLLWFSVIRNTGQILNNKPKEQELKCIEGVRFFTICWIICGHILLNHMNAFKNVFITKKHSSSLLLQPALKGLNAVDTFFFLSGLLTSYVIIGQRKKTPETIVSPAETKSTANARNKLRFIPFLLLRYLRLTPQVIFSIFVHNVVLTILDGPIWFFKQCHIKTAGITFWLANLAYIPNFLKFNDMCFAFLWFLGVDMQLHWLSLIPILYLMKNRRQGNILCLILIVGMILVTSIQVYIENIPPGFNPTDKVFFVDKGRFHCGPFCDIYFRPWAHGYVFFIGVIFGPYLRSFKMNSLTLSKRKILLNWLLCVGGYLFCVYSTSPWLYGRPYDRIWAAILFPLNRVMWAFSLCSLLLLSITDKESLICRILSWSGFRPFARMTYAAYLTHFWVVDIVQAITWVDFEIIPLYFVMLSTLFASFSVAFLFTLFIEYPFLNMMDYLREKVNPTSLKPSEAKIQV